MCNKSVWVSDDKMTELFEKLVTQEEAIQRIRRLHWEFKDPEFKTSWCNHSGNYYPCKTIQSLDGENK